MAPTKVVAALLDMSSSFAEFAECGKRALYTVQKTVEAQGARAAYGVIRGHDVLASGGTTILPVGSYTEHDVANAISGLECGGKTAVWETACAFGRQIRDGLGPSAEVQVTLFVITDGLDNDSTGEFHGPEGWRALLDQLQLAGINLQITWMLLMPDAANGGGGGRPTRAVRKTMQTLATRGHNGVIVRRSDTRFLHASIGHIASAGHRGGLVADSGDSEWSMDLAQGGGPSVAAVESLYASTDTTSLYKSYAYSHIASVMAIGDSGEKGALGSLRALSSTYEHGRLVGGDAMMNTEQADVILKHLGSLGTRCFMSKRPRAQASKRKRDAGQESVLGATEHIRSESGLVTLTTSHVNSLLYKLGGLSMVEKLSECPAVWRLTDHGREALRVYNNP